MDPAALTFELKDRRIQLFREGKWVAEAEVDWSTGLVRQIPRRVEEARGLIEELLVVLQCRCLLLSPEKIGLGEGMVCSQREGAAVPLFISDSRRSLTVAVEEVSAEILAQAHEAGRALLVSYRNLDTMPGNPVPKLMGMRVVSVSDFPKGWAHVDQMALIDLLPESGRTHADYQESFRLAVG